jgi:hypothetical protein
VRSRAAAPSGQPADLVESRAHTHANQQRRARVRRSRLNGIEHEALHALVPAPGAASRSRGFIAAAALEHHVHRRARTRARAQRYPTKAGVLSAVLVRSAASRHAHAQLLVAVGLGDGDIDGGLQVTGDASSALSSTRTHTVPVSGHSDAVRLGDRAFDSCASTACACERSVASAE